jgi:hypothetical protein
MSVEKVSRVKYPLRFMYRVSGYKRRSAACPHRRPAQPFLVGGPRRHVLIWSAKLTGTFGRDGDWAREALCFGFTVENAFHGVYRIWSRAWLVTK